MATVCEDAPASLRLKNLTCLKDIESAVQRIQYYRSGPFGRVLVIDGEIQHVEAWAPLYHETVVHLPCTFLRELKRVLILGGGDLFVAGEVLKYRSVSTVHLVDFDPAVTKATVEVYETAAAIAADPRLTVINAKAEDYVDSCSEEYDLVINDAVDLAYVNNICPIDLYKKINSLLGVDGICSDLIYRSIYDNDRFKPAIKKVKEQGRQAVSLVAIPEYPGIMHLLTLWGHNRLLSQDHKNSINIEHPRMIAQEVFLYFDPTYVPYYLYTPPYIKEHIR